MASPMQFWLAYEQTEHRDSDERRTESRRRLAAFRTNADCWWGQHGIRNAAKDMST